MKRTQIQLPNPLYREVKRIARLLDWSITEVLRRGAEYMVRCYPGDKSGAEDWSPPAPLKLGAFRAPVESWRLLANEPDLNEP